MTFDPSGFDLQDLLSQAQAMQEQLFTAQQELADARVDGTAGGDLVKATVTGAGELVALTIKPEAVDPEDVEMLQDLIISAVNEALRQAEEAMDGKMNALTSGLGLSGFGF